MLSDAYMSTLALQLQATYTCHRPRHVHWIVQGVLMNLKQVEAFRAVMATRSMTTAASLLHTSQPNISRWINLLEKDVGFVLFKRLGTRLVPTAEAQAFYQDVDRCFFALESLSESAKSIRLRGTGVLRIGAVGSFSINVLPYAIRKFRNIYPDVPVVVNTGRTDAVVQWVATGTCDIGFCSYKVDVANLHYQLNSRELGVCIVPKHHRLVGLAHITPADLAREPFISLEAGGVNRAAIDRHFVKDERVLSIETPYAPTICEMVNNGLGVSIVSPISLRSQRYENIIEIPFSEPVEFCSYAVVSDSLEIGLPAKALRMCVSETFKELLVSRG